MEVAGLPFLLFLAGSYFAQGLPLFLFFFLQKMVQLTKEHETPRLQYLFRFPELSPSWISPLRLFFWLLTSSAKVSKCIIKVESIASQVLSKTDAFSGFTCHRTAACPIRQHFPKLADMLPGFSCQRLDIAKLDCLLQRAPC